MNTRQPKAKITPLSEQIEIIREPEPCSGSRPSPAPDSATNPWQALAELIEKIETISAIQTEHPPVLEHLKVNAETESLALPLEYYFELLLKHEAMLKRLRSKLN